MRNTTRSSLLATLTISFIAAGIGFAAKRSPVPTSTGTPPPAPTVTTTEKPVVSPK